MIALYTMVYTRLQNKGQYFTATGILFCLFFAWLLLPGYGCSGSKKQTQEEAVAWVNGEHLLRKDLNKEIHRINRSYSLQPSDAETRKFEEEVLYQMIRRKLLTQEAEKHRIQLTPEKIRKAVSEQKGEISQEDFEKMLEKAGITYPEWENRIIEDRMIELLISSAINPKITIPEEELTAHHQAHQEEFHVQERVRVRQIVLSNKDEAKKVRERLTVGNEDFGLVAQEVSLSPDAEQGGEIGIFSRGEMPDEFDEICFSLQIEEISSVVKSPYGYHIFRVEERFPAGMLSFKESREIIMNKIFLEKREEYFTNYQKELWNRAEIKILLEPGQ